MELKGNVRHREDKCTWYKKQLQKSANEYFNLKSMITNLFEEVKLTTSTYPDSNQEISKQFGKICGLISKNQTQSRENIIKSKVFEEEKSGLERLIEGN